MCGIVGVIAQEPVAPLLLESLKKMEYRGYDSVDIATIDGTRICLRKNIGKLDAVQNEHHLDKLPGVVGIGRTRWATRGGVTAANAHPHWDCSHEVAVVHNGILDNYQELRKGLELRHTFLSETDTEVIPHLIEDYMKERTSLEQSVLMVMENIKGSYALLAISGLEPGKIVAARKDSPLVIGLDGNRSFIASDSLSFIDKTHQVIYADDGEVIVITNSKVSFLNAQGKEVIKSPVKISWEWGETTYQGYDHFMLKEIQEEPQSIRRAAIQDRNLINETAIDILRARQVIITGSGTSRYASIIGRYLFAKLSGTLCEVVMSSEFHYFADAVDKNTLIIAVSQSGETADTLRGAKMAKEKGARVLSVVNVVGSSLARLSDRVIYLNCGPEVCVAATKTFVAQLSIFYFLSYAMINQLQEGLGNLEEVSNILESYINANGHRLAEIADKTKHHRDFYYIAKGINPTIAGEGSLKLKEVLYLHAEGMPAGELKHGTLALIEQGTPVVVICPRDYTFEETLTSAIEVKARGGLVIGVSDEDDSTFDEWVPISKVEEIFYPLITIVPLQLFAYQLAVVLGKDPDKPCNLAKSVTVN
ncbi:MAG: glutamine--fructose-6-phosphate transaminase (isomerizing) [Chloroflexota bacterium]|nr:glutamine--fructose-6-phosphate transaminase (isomerizing) [Chloroflexota bacterium]